MTRRPDDKVKFILSSGRLVIYYKEQLGLMMRRTGVSGVIILFQLAGLVLLGAGLGLGVWWWVRPHTPLDYARLGLLLLVILTLMGGFIGAPFWWIDEPRSFSWDLPPLASRLLASAGWAFALACLLALQRPTLSRLRLITLMLAIYLAPLAIAILLFHLDRFDWGAPITYAFFVIVGVMTAGALWYLWSPVGVLAPLPNDEAAPASPTRLWLGLVALLLGFWGLALLITDAGPSALVWLWPGDLLTSRLIAVMLLTLAAAALYSRRTVATAQITLAASVVYGVGVVVANGWNLLAARPMQPLYVVVFGIVAAVSLWLLWWESRRSRMVRQEIWDVRS